MSTNIQNEIRRFIIDTGSICFQSKQIEHYQNFCVEDKKDKATAFQFSHILNEIWSEDEDGCNYRTGYTKIYCLDDAYLKEENITLELTTVEDDQKKETFFLQVDVNLQSNKHDFNYRGAISNFEDEKGTVSSFNETQPYLEELLSNLSLPKE